MSSAWARGTRQPPLPAWAGPALHARPGTGWSVDPAASLPVTQTLRGAALEDCALCQETLSSSELVAKTRDGDLEGVWSAGPPDACSLAQTPAPH